MDTPIILEVIKEGQTYAMTPETLLDELHYASYKENRMLSPDLTAAQWKTIYPQGDALEARYQAEQQRPRP